MSYSKHHLSGKDKKQLIMDLTDTIQNPEEFFPKKEPLLKLTFAKNEALITRSTGEVLFIILNNDIVPSLKLARNMELLVPQVIVDLGAIKFVTNGADIMRPGITKIDDKVLEGGIVVVVEERNNAPLCFGKALYDAVDMLNMKSGKCIRNIHWLKDKWFDFAPEKI